MKNGKKCVIPDLDTMVALGGFETKGWFLL